MSERHPDDASVDPAQFRRIDPICDRFEADWKEAVRKPGNKWPKGIEDYLREAQQSDRAVLFRGLLPIEVEYRRQTGDKPTAEEFHSRFPEYRQVIDELFEREDDQALGRPRFPIRLNCPHCENPIAIIEDQAADEVICPSCGSSFRLDPDRTVSCAWSSEKLPQLGKFELLEAVGQGAFGTVYKAHDTELDRIVAVKVPRSGTFGTQEDENRFVREGRAAAQLEHPGIVALYEVGRTDEFPYLVSEFVEGVTLAEVLDSRSGRTFSFHETADLMAQVAEAIQHSHERGVVHRDLKPSNIMLKSTSQPTAATSTGSQRSTLDFRPMVMDFGLARRDEREIAMTADGQVLGTPAYMSPEQAKGKGKQADGRSDVYSLGVILYELLTDELPFQGTMHMVRHQHIHDEPRSPRRLNDRIPRDLETICLKAMAKEPDKRFQTARELADELQRWLVGEPIKARPVSTTERLWRWCRRNPAIAGLIAVAALLLLTLSIGGPLIALQQAENAREQARLRRQADDERQKAVTAQQEEASQRRRADENFRQAQQAVDDYLTLVSQSKLLNVPGLQPLRKELLESALKYYQGFIQERGDNPTIQAELAKAFLRIASITDQIGSKPEAINACQETLKIYEKLVRQNPGVSNYQYMLGKTYHYLGDLQHQSGRDEEAEKSYQKAIAIFDKLVRYNPKVAALQNTMANSYVSFGDLQHAIFKPTLDTSNCTTRQTPRLYSGHRRH